MCMTGSGWQERVLPHHWVGGQKYKDWSNFSVKRNQCSKSIPHSIQRMPQLGVHHLPTTCAHTHARTYTCTHAQDLENRMGSETECHILRNTRNKLFRNIYKGFYFLGSLNVYMYLCVCVCFKLL